ncbi:Uncharacterized protein At4g02000 [Linum perenne]
MVPSEDLFHSLKTMLIWVKITGMPFGCRTTALGRKLLVGMGQVLRMGYFDARTPEGLYVKGRVRMNLLEPFLGTTMATSDDGVSFPVFFSYEKISCICYLCGYLGHFMSECPFPVLEYDVLVQGSWMHLKINPDEEESQGPGLLRSASTQPQAGTGRGGLHPSVAAGLSSTLQRQWARGGRFGGVRRGAGFNPGGPCPLLAILGLTAPPHRQPSLGPAGPAAPGLPPCAIRPFRSFSSASSAAGDSSGTASPGEGIVGPALGSPGSASSSGPVSAIAGRRMNPPPQDGSYVPTGLPLNPDSRPAKRQTVDSDGLGSTKFHSAPVLKNGLSAYFTGFHSAPPIFNQLNAFILLTWALVPQWAAPWR